MERWRGLGCVEVGECEGKKSKMEWKVWRREVEREGKVVRLKGK